MVVCYVCRLQDFASGYDAALPCDVNSWEMKYIKLKGCFTFVFDKDDQ